MNIRAKILEEPTVIDARYGKCIITKVRILQNGEDVAIFSKLGDPVAASKTKGQHVLIAKNAKGKYQIVDDTSSNGNNIHMNRPSSQQEGYVSTQESSYYTYSNNGSNTPSTRTYSQPASNAPNTAVNNHNSVGLNNNDITLDLPIYGKADSDRVKAFIQQRSKILAYCVECIRRDMGPDAFGEVSLKSLAVSLYISITKHLE